MTIYKAEKQLRRMCEVAGLKLNGSARHDPQILKPQEFYKAFAKNPFMAMGESFCAKHYDVEDLQGMFSRLVQAQMRGDLQKLLTVRQKITLFAHKTAKGLVNPNNRKSLINRGERGQMKIAKEHYDLDNDLMIATLGVSMKYTSGYWQLRYGEFDLDTAQKLDLEITGRRMGLKEGMKILDIGFGYGFNTKYLVDRFGIHVTGITISAEQKKFAEKVCNNISDKATFILSDWRDIQPGELGHFDRIIIFELIESIGGYRNYSDFFRFVSDSLKKDGAIFMQAINTNKITKVTNPWIDKYIFPNGVLPTVAHMMSAAEQSGLHSRLMDNSLGWANGQTLKSWWKNFEEEYSVLKNKIDEELKITKEEKYKKHFEKIFPYKITNDTFPRIWKYYMLSCYAAHDIGYVNDGHFIWEKNPENAFKPDIQIPQTRKDIDELLR